MTITNASEKQSVWRNIWWDLYRIGWSDWIGLKLNGGGRIYFGPLWHQFSSRAVSHGLDSILLWIMFPSFPGPFIICSLICGLYFDYLKSLFQNYFGRAFVNSLSSAVLRTIYSVSLLSPIIPAHRWGEERMTNFESKYGETSCHVASINSINQTFPCNDSNIIERAIYQGTSKFTL